MIKVDHIKKICPNNKNPQQIADALNRILPKYDIESKEQIACFIAQCAHESGEFNIFQENLNYSADGLCKTWSSRFNASNAQAYSKNPEKIGNKVYADRMGNGNEASGDGYKFRGRGCIQITGKETYSKFAKSIGKSLDETVAYCSTIDGAIESACWFWVMNRLNRFVDKQDFTGLTKAINGGTNGLVAREHLYKRAISVL